MNRTYHLSEFLKLLNTVHDYKLDLDDDTPEDKRRYLDAVEYAITLVEGDLYTYGDGEITMLDK